jgi:thiol:disulfide interchange protein DsbC
MRALTQRLPRTAVTKVDCAQVPGICEVQAGTNLFYIDPSARYLIVGRIYDMETHQDLTAARLLAINPDMLVGAAASAKAQETDARALRPRIRNRHRGRCGAGPRSKGEPCKPSSQWSHRMGGGNASAPKVTVFSDFLRLLPRAAPDPQGHGRSRHRAADLDPRHAGDFEA